MTNNLKEMANLAYGFVEISGGIANFKKTKDHLWAVVGYGEGELIVPFLEGLAKDPPSAKAILASSMLGFRFAALIYEELETPTHEEKP